MEGVFNIASLQEIKVDYRPRLQIVEAPHLTETVHDWSRCRSPSRARRRARLGHKQRDQFVQVPMQKAIEFGGKMYMHPALLRRVRDTVGKSIDQDILNAFQRGYR